MLKTHSSATFGRFALMAISAATLALFAASPAAAAPFQDGFDTLDSAWVTDRYEPNEFVVASFDGDNRLKIGIHTDQAAANRGGQNTMFYNTQGRQRAAEILGPWTISADLYVDASFQAAGVGDPLRRTDLWVTPDPTAASLFPIIGFTNQSLTDADALDPDATDREARLRVWNTDDAWVDLGLPVGFQFDAWHSLEITGTGDTFEFRLDGDLMHTDVLTTPHEGLNTVFLQAYNYGDSNYSVYWDNVSTAAVPEPSTVALLGIAGIGLGLCVWRRRRRA